MAENQDDPHVFKAKVRRAVMAKSFGRQLNDDELRFRFAQWNRTLQQTGDRFCDFHESRSKSGCNLPLCPMCGLRQRMRACLAPLSWHWRWPEADMTIMAYTIYATDPQAFLDLFEPAVQKRFRGRTREQTRLISTITCTAPPKTIGGKLSADLAEKSGMQTEQSFWIHRRIGVLFHDPATAPSRRRPVNLLSDPEAMALFTSYSASELATDFRIHETWRKDPNHYGSIIVGAMVHYLLPIIPAAALIKQEQVQNEMLSLVHQLRDSGAAGAGGRKYLRTRWPPGVTPLW